MAAKKSKLPVFVGRFQPLHKGHLEVMKELSKQGKFAIVIGSMQEFYKKDNPFTFFERREMIERSLKAEGIKNFKIYGLPDLRDNVDWAKKLVEIIGSKNIAIYTMNGWPRKCMESISIEVRQHEIYFGISSTQVREKIRSGREWKNLVPNKVGKYLKNIGGENRIRLSGIPAEKQIISFIRSKVRESGAKGCIVGLSGGIDSAVVAALTKKAIGKKAFFVHLPVVGKPCPNAELLKSSLNIEIQTISLEGVYDNFLKALPKGNRIAQGNIQSRLRMCALYYFANQNKLLVIGTTNRSELEIGYFTKYGDGGADIEPIADLYKTEIFELGQKLGLPEKIVSSSPTAGLWKDQTDEAELGLNYFRIDTILKMAELGIPEKEISFLANIGLKKAKDILSRKKSGLHKLITPQICRVKPS